MLLPFLRVWSQTATHNPDVTTLQMTVAVPGRTSQFACCNNTWRRQRPPSSIHQNSGATLLAQRLLLISDWGLWAISIVVHVINATVTRNTRCTRLDVMGTYTLKTEAAGWYPTATPQGVRSQKISTWKILFILLRVINAHHQLTSELRYHNRYFITISNSYLFFVAFQDNRTRSF